jgi:hypothetical protein
MHAVSELEQQLQQLPASLASFDGSYPAGFGGNSLTGWLSRLKWDLQAQVKEGRTTGDVAIVTALMAKKLSELLNEHSSAAAAAAGAASILAGSSSSSNISSSRELQLEVCRDFQRALLDLSQHLVVLAEGNTLVGGVVQGWVGAMRGRQTAAAATTAADVLMLQLAKLL